MGQYYKPAILNNNREKTRIMKWAYSWDYDCGLKLMEHSYIGNPLVNVIENELKENPQVLVWAGDYAPDCKNRKSNIYMRCQDLVKIKPDSTSEKFDHKTYRYVVNHDKKLFVDKTKVKKIPNWGARINPLPLLTSEGNGSGGGDYWGSNEMLVGSWARNLVSIEKEIPEGYSELKPDFTEGRNRY